MEKNQKKLIIFMPSIDGGGVEKNLFIISDFLSNKIKDLTVITFDDRFKSKFNKKIKVLNIINKPKKKYKKYYKYLRCLLLLLIEVKKQKCLVFAFQANIYCCILSLIFNFKLITRSNSSPSGWNKNFFKNLVFKFLFKVPKKIIVNSKDFKREIDKKFNINTKVIYNPLNTSEIKILSNKKFKFTFFDNAKIKAINIARFTDQKDHMTLLKAMLILIKKKIDIKLLIMGYGTNKKKMRNFISKNKISKNLKIINFQKNPYKFLKKSNLFILTSLYEGLPNVLLEAMVLKKFIISSNCPTGPKEILKNGKYGDLFNVGDYMNLSKKIIRYNKNSQLNRSKINLAYKNLERFDYIKNCEEYFRIVYKNF